FLPIWQAATLVPSRSFFPGEVTAPALRSPAMMRTWRRLAGCLTAGMLVLGTPSILRAEQPTVPPALPATLAVPAAPVQAPCSHAEPPEPWDDVDFYPP